MGRSRDSNRSWGDEAAAACCPLFVPDCCGYVPCDIAEEFDSDVATGRISKQYLLPLSEDLRAKMCRCVTAR